MGRSLRTTLSADRGTTQWLATAASGALLVAVVASLPAFAGEPDAAPQEAVSTVVDAGADGGVEAILGEPLEDEVVGGFVEDAATDFGGVIGEPLEDEVLDQSATDYEGVIDKPLEDEALGGVVEDAATDYEGVIGEPLEDEVPTEG